MITGSEYVSQITVDVAGLEWMDWASCLDTDPELFHPEKGQRAGPAKRICMGCAVRGECREYAMTVPDMRGVWGATTERDRDRIRAKRNRARKAAAA
jgi:WhiB family redox-sensing transcriptional regulator